MRRQEEIDDRLAWAREQKDEKDRHATEQWYDGWIRALEWVQEDDPFEEKMGKRFETCPVKGVDCDKGPFYGMMLLHHMKNEHPDSYDKVTQ